MRRHHGFLGSIADKITRHKELKHTQRLSDDLARGDMYSAEYHASKADQWGDAYAQLNAPRVGVVYSGVGPVQHTFATSTVVVPNVLQVANPMPMGVNSFHRESSTTSSPMVARIHSPVHTQNLHSESHKVHDQSNGGSYHSESVEVRSPTGYHTESHEVVDQRSLPSTMHTNSPGFESHMRQEQMNTANIGAHSQVQQHQTTHQSIQSPSMPGRDSRYTKDVHQTVTRQTDNSPVSPYMPANNHTAQKVVRHTETQNSTTHINPFSPGADLDSSSFKKDSYYSQNSDSNNFGNINTNSHKVSHKEEHHETNHGRY